MTDIDMASRGRESAESGIPCDALPITARQEQFSLGFIRLVAAAAGCSIKSHETDYDGVDITIVASAEYSKYYCPEFDMQLKCTTQHRRLGADHLAWSMERDRFVKLVNPKRYIPALLAVLLIPENPDELVDLSEAGLTSSSRMYWEYAANLGGMDDDKGSKTVHLPRKNLFDVDGLNAIMRTIGEGGQW
ncbi:DUF4365 domain-containing protein [Nocardia sp. NBC_01377]|uniref:DUF4365 domain-containing protein n=1 Tax=Nocardia TaxID=1817 RepID=UPI001C21EC77|nr:DUF4365 domain-containing protein [Nocardia noduli]